MGRARGRGGPSHQGTVWPCLAGAFIEAWLRIHGKRARQEVRRRFLDPLLENLDAAGVGHISEIADGDAPHHPLAAPPAQARGAAGGWGPGGLGRAPVPGWGAQPALTHLLALPALAPVAWNLVIILGLVLGVRMETNLRRALIVSDGSFSIFFANPLTKFLWVVVLVVMVGPVALSRVRKARQQVLDPEAEL